MSTRASLSLACARVQSVPIIKLMESEIQIDTNPPPKPIQADTPPTPVLPASEIDTSIDTSPSTPDADVDAKGGEVEPPKAIEVPIKTIDEDAGKKIVELQKKQQGRDVSGEPDAKVLYDTPDSDPTLASIKKSTSEQAIKKANLNFDEIASFNPDYKGKSLDESISEELSKLEASAMDQFIIDYPEKAEQYKNDPAIQGALERKLHSEAQKDQETLRLLGYSEEEIQAEFEKHPHLLANEKITFLMLKNLRDSKDLPQDLKNELLAVYNDKLQSVFLRKINEVRTNSQKVTVDQIKDADIRSLIASLEENPELAEKTTQFLQMIEEVVSEKNKVVQDMAKEDGSTDGVEESAVEAKDRQPIVSESEEREKSKKISLRKFFKRQIKEAGGVVTEVIKKKLEKYKKEDFFDLSEFLEFLIEGGSEGIATSGGESEAGQMAKEGKQVILLGVSTIKEYTMNQPEAEKMLLVQGLVGAGYSDEAKMYAEMTAEEVFRNTNFQNILRKAVDLKEKEFSSGVTKTLKKDHKEYELSSEALAYVLNIPKIRTSEER